MTVTNLKAMVERFELEWLERALEWSKGNKALASRMLGMQRVTYVYKLNRLRARKPKAELAPLPDVNEGHV